VITVPLSLQPSDISSSIPPPAEYTKSQHGELAQFISNHVRRKYVTFAFSFLAFSISFFINVTIGFSFLFPEYGITWQIFVIVFRLLQKTNRLNR